MILKTITIVIGILLPKMTVFSQQPKALHVGDKIPVLAFQHVLNSPDQNINFSDYQDKYIILDFWATTCGSCIGKFPAVDSLAKAHKDKLVVLGVTNEQTALVKNFYARRDSLGIPTTKLVTITNDTILHKLFPHRTVPHLVWINRQGKVAAITSSADLSAKNTSDFFRDLGVQATAKYDISARKPLFLSDNLPPTLQLTSFQTLIKGYYSGLPTGTRWRKKEDTVYGICITNQSLEAIYENVASRLFDQNKQLFSPLRVAKDVSIGHDALSAIYSIDYILPTTSAGVLYASLMRYLNTALSLQVSVEKRTVQCYQLSKIESTDSMRMSPTKVPANTRRWETEKLIRLLENNSNIDHPIVCAAGLANAIPFPFAEQLSTDAVKSLLLSAGFQLKDTTGTIDMLIIKSSVP